jgi:hypothetical protein
VQKRSEIRRKRVQKRGTEEGEMSGEKMDAVKSIEKE